MALQQVTCLKYSIGWVDPLELPNCSDHLVNARALCSDGQRDVPHLT